jgi:hypothetical protein
MKFSFLLDPTEHNFQRLWMPYQLSTIWPFSFKKSEIMEKGETFEPLRRKKEITKKLYRFFVFTGKLPNQHEKEI